MAFFILSYTFPSIYLQWQKRGKKKAERKDNKKFKDKKLKRYLKRGEKTTIILKQKY